MASGSKTEQPTARRLRKARREGDHPVSQAAIAFAALGFALLAAPGALGELHRSVLGMLLAALQPAATPRVDDLAWRVAALALPVLGMAALGGLIAGLWQTGAALNLRSVRWDARRLNPFAPGTSSWSGRAVVVALGLGAVLASLAAAGAVLEGAAPGLAASIGDERAPLALSLELARQLALCALGVAALVASADLALRRAQWKRRHRMTRDEVRREQREAEGDPELRHARREVHRELANTGTLGELGRAQLLLIGEPRLAVGLAYDADHDRAPRVILHGSGALSLTLEALATSLGVPVQRDDALARALARVPAGSEVPRALYAEVAFVMQAAGIVRRSREPHRGGADA